MSFLSTVDYFSRPLPKENWLIDHLVPRGGTVQLYGKPKSGKSFFAMTLASAIADGHPYFLTKDFTINVPSAGTVLFLQLDTPPGLWTEYLLSSKRKYIKVLWADALQIPEPPFDLGTDIHMNWLSNQVKEHQPIMLVVDSLRELHRSDENDSASMTKVFSRLRKAVGLDCAVFLIHHQKKIGMDEVPDLIESSRGASYIAGKVDVLMRLAGQSPDRKIFDYVGRTRQVTQGLRLWQDTNTGMIYHGSLRRNMILDLFHDLPGVATLNQFADLCVTHGVEGSRSTIRRDLEEMELFKS